jgi:hypothetical protein
MAPPPPALEGTLVPPASVPPAAPDPVAAFRATVVQATADAFALVGKQAYLEVLARTEPRIFLAWAQLVLGDGRAVPAAPNSTVVNVLSALPRSDLDALPPGFNLR